MDKLQNRKPKPKRKWKQFGLRGLVLLLTVIALALGRMSQPMVVARNEARIIRLVQQTGGGVYRYEYADGWLRQILPSFVGDKVYQRASDIRLGFQPPSDDLFKGLASLTHLTDLSLLEATDAVVAKLPAIETLQALDVSDSTVSDACLASLARYPNLIRLNCANTAITLTALGRIQQSNPLQFSLSMQKVVNDLLQFPEMQFTIRNAEGETEIARRSPNNGERIVAVEFSFTPLPASLEQLAYFTDLESLTIDGSPPDEPKQFFQAIGQLPKLTTLTIQLRAPRDPYSPFLGHESNSRSVRESEREIENCLDPLANLTNLEHLSFRYPFATSCEFLGRLSKLQTLAMNNLANESLAQLAHHQQLWRLSGTLLAPESDSEKNALDHIAKIENLTELSIYAEYLIDDDLVALSSMTNLEDLRIQGAHIVGPGAKHLQGLVNLKKVDIPSLHENFRSDLQKQLGTVKMRERSKYDERSVYTANENRQKLLEKTQQAADRELKKLQSGDYEEGKQWYRHRQFANALRAQCDYDQAAAAYGTAVDLLIEKTTHALEIGSLGTSESRAEQHEIINTCYYAALVHFGGRSSPADALAVINRSLPFSGIATESSGELELPPFQPEYVTPFQQAPNPRQQATLVLSLRATLQAKLSQPANAFISLMEYRKLQSEHDVGRQIVDPARLASLRAAAIEQLGNGNLDDEAVNSVANPSSFLVATEAKMELNSARLQQFQWQPYANEPPFIVVVAPLGKELDAIAFQLPESDSELVAWCGGSHSRSPTRMVLAGKAASESGKVRIDVPYRVSAVFVHMPGDLNDEAVRSNASVFVQAKLRDVGSGESLPWMSVASKLPSTETTVRVAPFRMTPCWLVGDDNVRVGSFPAAPDAMDASLARMPDSTFLLAHTASDVGVPQIMLANSSDGVHWSEPRAFSFNRTHTATSPHLLTGDDGTIWMVFNSLHGIGADNLLWCSSSKDSRAWTEPDCLGTYYTDRRVMEFLRCPNGDYLINCHDGYGRGPSPSQITRFETWELPDRTGGFMHGVPQVSFDDQGTCHVVLTVGRSGEIAYSYSKDMIEWSPIAIVAQSDLKNIFRIRPRLVIENDNAALLFAKTGQLAIKQAKLTATGLEFGREKGSEEGWSDLPLLRDGDRLLTVVNYPDRYLRTLSTSDLFGYFDDDGSE